MALVFRSKKVQKGIEKYRKNCYTWIDNL